MTRRFGLHFVSVLCDLPDLSVRLLRTTSERQIGLTYRETTTCTMPPSRMATSMRQSSRPRIRCGKHLVSLFCWYSVPHFGSVDLTEGRVQYRLLWKKWQGCLVGACPFRYGAQNSALIPHCRVQNIYFRSVTQYNGPGGIVLKV